MKTKMGMGAAAAALLLCASAGNADVLEFNIDTRFGDEESHQADGYVNVKFTSFFNSASENHEVKLTITSFLASGGLPNPYSEYLAELYFNFNDGKMVENLLFSGGGSGDTPTPEQKSGTFANPKIEFERAEPKGPGSKGFQADGDGIYDILFSFSADAGSRFNESDSVEYLISHTGEDIFASDFWYLAEKGGGHGPYYAAGHIRGLAGDKSGWHSATLVPLPTPVYLGLAGLGLAAGVSAVKRRR